jgi:hypothetical protein
MLTREQILSAVAALNERLRVRDVHGELGLLGGAVMLLVFQARASTRDVDAIFSPSSEIRAAVAEVAEELDLPPDWLNDGAKGFLSPHGEFVEVDLPRFSHLRITCPVPEYLLAMKVLASRVESPAGHGDRDDIATLCRRLGVRDADHVMEIVLRYYPPARVSPRAVFLVREILASIHNEDRQHE